MPSKSKKVLLISALLPVLLAGCSRKPSKTAHRWFGMDTDFNATLYRPGEAGKPLAKEAEAFALLEGETTRLEKVFSDYLPGSSLKKLSGHAGDTLATDAEIMEVFRAAGEMAEASRGSFDITLHDLKGAWGLASGDSNRVPSDSELAAVLRGNPAYGASPDSNPAAHPPFRLLEGNRLVLLREGAAFDLGGIAKGYAVDRMHALLDSLGYPDHIVTAGGDLRVGGSKGREPWVLGIRHPRHPDALAGTMTLDKVAAVSTSGDYERYFLRNGIRYHHIFDPRTGKPARPYCSVTVLADNSLLADRLTKPLFILGPGRGQALLRRFGARAIWMREAPGAAPDTAGGPGLCRVASAGLSGVLHIKDIPACAEEAP